MSLSSPSRNDLFTVLERDVRWLFIVLAQSGKSSTGRLSRDSTQRAGLKPHAIKAPHRARSRYCSSVFRASLSAHGRLSPSRRTTNTMPRRKHCGSVPCRHGVPMSPSLSVLSPLVVLLSYCKRWQKGPAGQTGGRLLCISSCSFIERSVTCRRPLSDGSCRGQHRATLPTGSTSTGTGQVAYLTPAAWRC